MFLKEEKSLWKFEKVTHKLVQKNFALCLENEKKWEEIGGKLNKIAHLIRFLRFVSTWEGRLLLL